MPMQLLKRLLGRKPSPGGTEDPACIVCGTPRSKHLMIEEEVCMAILREERLNVLNGSYR